MKKILAVCVIAASLACAALAAEPARLPEPAKSGGAALLDCLSARRAERTFSGETLSEQELSDLLWAAGGVSSADGRLTYPTALDVRDIVIYAFTAAGAFRYDPAENALVPVVPGDCRAATGMQPFVAGASVNLVYVHDASRWTEKKVPVGKILEFGCVHAGAAAQNASLFAAAKGWACVVRGSVDRVAVARLLGLGEGQLVLLAQSIGPKPKQ